MKKRFLYFMLSAFILGSFLGIAQFSSDTLPVSDTVDYSSLRTIENTSWTTGEELRYRVHYGFINAGEAFVRVEDTEIRGDREVFHIHGEGHSTGMFRWGYKVDYIMDSYVDSEAMAPWEFVRNVRDGGYRLYREINFDQLNNKAYTDGEEFEVPPHVQDLLSAFYFSRSVDLESLEYGDSISIPTFLDHEIFPLILVYRGVEEVDSDLGDIECLSFQPIVQTGRVFKEAEGMTIYVSNDLNRIPIQLKSELVFGSVKMDLTEARGLKHPLKTK